MHVYSQNYLWIRSYKHHTELVFDNKKENLHFILRFYSINWVEQTSIKYQTSFKIHYWFLVKSERFASLGIFWFVQSLQVFKMLSFLRVIAKAIVNHAWIKFPMPKVNKFHSSFVNGINNDWCNGTLILYEKNWTFLILILILFYLLYFTLKNV